MTAYATRRDVFNYGLTRGALSNPGRIVASAVASSDTVTLADHGFETDDEVIVRPVEGGTMPAPLVSNGTYYIRRVTDSTFKLAATPGGAAINLTTDAVNMVVSEALPFDDVLEFYSRFVDGFLPAHLVPLTNPDALVVGIVAELAAKKLQLIAGVSSESMKETELGAKAQLERWVKGIPLRGTSAASANLAVTSAISATPDPRGWGSRNLP